MKRAVLALILVFFALFLLTTYSESPHNVNRAREDFTAQEIEEGLELSRQRKLIYWAGSLLNLGFLLAVACTPRARRLADWFERWAGSRWWLAVLLMGGFCFAAEELLNVPLALIGLENLRAWDLTHRSFADWFLDYAKRLALSAGMGAVVLLGLYALLRRFPRYWWAAAGMLAGLLSVAIAYILPIWIAPVFNTFTPLNEYAKLDGHTRTHLENSIRELANHAGVEVQDVLVMDASRQGSHTNAYFTGFGSTRRIVLYDTLLESHKGHPEEVVSILAHEIGHWRNHHILKGLALGTAGGFVALFMLSCILRWAVNRRPFLLKSPADPASLPLILLLSFLGSWLVLPVGNFVSRQFEREADWAALELTQQPEVFIAAEKQLARANKSNLAPAPFSVFWFATHPPAVERIQMARDWSKTK